MAARRKFSDMQELCVRNVQEMQDEKGWTDAELARRAGISRNIISTMKLRRSFPRPHFIEAVARALAVSVARLYGRDGRFDPAERPIMLELIDNDRARLRIDVIIPAEAAFRAHTLVTQAMKAQDDVVDGH